jgi:LuxR family maltose regulon positive regulatory protein
LDQVVRGPLTLVVAPAGAGKTTLLSGWVAETQIPTAWLSLDDGDADGVQLWSGLIAALETLVPGCGDRARTLLDQPDSLLDAVGELLDDLDDGDRPLAVLVLDDVHVLDDHDLPADSLALFLQNLPEWLHVVVLARRKPRLPIDRLRVRGRLGEIHFSALQFSPAEASDLLSRIAPTLSEDEVTAAAARAGGWAAGLQLAALAARAERAMPEVPGPTDSGELLVDDYVWHEVLRDESPELIESLLDTAVVDRVNSSLARALTGRDDAGDLLLLGETRGLFVTRLGTDGWFEVHALVREALVAETARRSPGRVAEQHARAARWFEEAGDVPTALSHWLLAARPRDALRLLALKNADLYDGGLEATIERTVRAIPMSVATADHQAMIDFAWCHLLVDRHRFLGTVGQLAGWASEAADVDSTVRRRVAMLQSIAATMTGDWAEGAELARRTVLDLGEGWSLDPLGRFGWNLIARDIALSEHWDDRDCRVREASLALNQAADRRLAFEGTRALGEVLAGRPVDALRIAAGVRESAAVSSMSVLRAELAAAEAIAHRELGDRSRAVAELLTLAELPGGPVLYCRLLALLELTQAHLDEGDVLAAASVFADAEELVEAEFPGRQARAWLARVGTLVALASGEFDEARRWSADVEDRFWAGVGTARVHLAEGRRLDAVAALETAEPRCPRHHVVRELLWSQAVLSRDDQLRRATSAVEQAVANGLLQTVASEGAEVLRIVELASWRAPAPWLDRLRRAASPRLGAMQVHRSNLAEALTERERDVLRLLPSRLTLREIAGELCISVNTLKFHLKVIYRKLGVASRAEAADVARKMTRLPRPVSRRAL